MATIVQKNAIKPLPNGAVTHLVMDQYMMKDVVQAQNMITDGVQAQNMKDIVQAQNNVIQEPVNEEEPEVDIVINNVVCSFSVRCHLNLRQIALNGVNVEYRREHGVSDFGTPIL